MAGVENRAWGIEVVVPFLAALRALLQSPNLRTCPWKIEKEKWTAFCPSSNWHSASQKLAPEKWTAFCPSGIWNNSRKPFHNSTPFRLITLCCILLYAPPLDPSGINRVWGAGLLSLSLPRIPLGSTGYGTLGGRRKSSKFI